MPRQNRVLSFMSEWGGNHHYRRNSHARTPSNVASDSPSPAPPSPAKQANAAVSSPNASTTALDSGEAPQSPSSRARSDSKPSSRPVSMIQTYQPPVMDVTQDTLPELQRIFTFLNSHSNKLYQEGYFLKFHDTDSRGRPAPDRVWQECFAQLVGTILSLWDASELDSVGGDAEVLPTFINLTDAAIHMMPSMVLNDGKKLDNVLSVSTAASNKYLFHFNSFNSLTQWTAGIRLAMYEHTTLQEAYTGALIAGKGKSLNNIRIILDRQRAKHDDWARVRFGAGTPWRRCWCVVEPPDEKEYAKLQKQAKKNPYGKNPVLKGSVKFYDTNKIKKKTRPIATVTEAFSCYAIYPQSKPLIDQSTLVKIEGRITIHGNPETTTEGFVFVMPETHPAVSGFEIMLRYLFPVFDTFSLYGRPQKLIADVLDTRGLMFAMPPDRRYGYLEMWDVVSLIHTEGSQNWSERQWRKQLKELTSKRMLSAPSRNSSRASRTNRVSLPPSRTRSLRFEGSVRSQPSSRQPSPSRGDDLLVQKTRRVDSAPPSSFGTPRHQRSVSEAHGYKKYMSETPSRLNQMIGPEEFDSPPPPPVHRELNGTVLPRDSSDTSSGEPSPGARDIPEVQIRPTGPPRDPVDLPPSFNHAPSQRPPVRPYQPPPSMVPNAEMDSATLDQLADATNQPIPANVAAAGAAAAWRGQESLQNRRSGDYDRNGQQAHPNAHSRGLSADSYSNSSHSGLSGSRLPTIPASPYVEQTEYVESPTSPAFHPTAPPVPEHAQLPQRSSTDFSLRPHSGSGDAHIHRKPVPGRSPLSSPRGDVDNRSTTSSSLGSLRNQVIDAEALDSWNRASLLRSTSKSSSRYGDDAASTSTPDYASTVSEEVQPRKALPGRREDRPRSGMLKSIGKADVNVGGGGPDNTHDTLQELANADIPTIDFGPTYSLTAPVNGNKRPGTSGTLTQALHDNESSKSKENFSPALTPPPSDPKRQSWLGGGSTPIAAMHVRSNSASPNLAADSRTVPWQPGMATHTSSNKPRLDPEEWVNQRASVAYPPRASPVYAHGRSKSHTPPPLSRGHSGDWVHLQRTPGTPGTPGTAEVLPARPPSRPLSRPVSRGAATLLDQRPTSLSAREQEQVARMTGTPLLDLQRDNKKSQESTEGLTAYIGHREKEKAKAKSNRNTASMQAEVERRMMAQQQKEMERFERQQMREMVAQQRAMTPTFASGAIAGTGVYSQPAYAYSSPDQLSVFQQQQGYLQQPGAVSPTTPGMMGGMPGAWGATTPSPALSSLGMNMGAGMHQSPYFAQQQQQMSPGYAASTYSIGPPALSPAQQHLQQQQLSQQQGYGQQQQQRPYTQPYGASFDQAQAQAQAAARFAHLQQQNMHRR